jgi:hypothetical protein
MNGATVRASDHAGSDVLERLRRFQAKRVARSGVLALAFGA